EEAKEQKVQKHLPTVITGTGCCKAHEVGDLVWAKVGTYPWWPCMVSCDPQQSVHTRINTRGHREYHVQFFGSVAERAWIHEKRVVVYQGEHQFEQLQAETLRKTSNPAERHKLLKPTPQRERAQWEVGVGHAEDALPMTREERIETYTFIYVEPDAAPPGAGEKAAAKVERRGPRRSRGSLGGRDSGPAEGEQPPRRQQPRRQCSLTGAEDTPDQEEPAAGRSPSAGPLAPGGPSEPPPQQQQQQQQAPPVKAPWKTAAARKLLPLSITMKKLNVQITKCDWPLPRDRAPSPGRAEGEAKQADPASYSPRGCSGKAEAVSKDQEKAVSATGRRSEPGAVQHGSTEASSEGLWSASSSAGR
ncbi:hypothetical protein COCON_G00159950, partial [Conger conger]